MGYPKAEGLPELRQAIAGWCDRRFGVQLDPDAELIPTYGSKEAIFSFAQLIVDPSGPQDTVVVTEPGYPVPARGAAFAGRPGARRCRCWSQNGFLPDLDGRRRLGPGRALLGQLPEQPDGRDRPARFLRAARPARAAEHDFLLCSDEAYSELWFDRAAALGASARRTGRTSSSSRRCPSARR